MKIVARSKEKKILQSVLDSNSPELVVIYGRHRVGKTYLIRNFYETRQDVTFFKLTGQKQDSGKYAPLKTQLANFKYQFERTFQIEIPRPTSWQRAFEVLKKQVEKVSKSKRKLVLFFDEVPWLCSPRLGFFESLDQAWNTTFERYKNVKVIVCGSAASWMLQNFIHAKAGFSRRTTRRIELVPFSLQETRKYLLLKGFDLSLTTIAEAYMILGGIPYYLNILDPQKSIHQNIEDECINQNGRLVNEYGTIFTSMFKNPALHKKVTEFIASKNKGVLLKELKAKFSSPGGGTLVRTLANLTASGLINKTPPLYNQERGSVYSVKDEFVFFYLNWMKSTRYTATESLKKLDFRSIAKSRPFADWKLYAFERLCLKHEYQIRKAIGIHKIMSVPSMVYFFDNDSKRSSQIDLLFDRADRIISMIEIRDCAGDYEITESDIRSIISKKQDLQNYLSMKKKGRKGFDLCYVTLHGLAKNRAFYELEPTTVTLEDLFRDDPV